MYSWESLKSELWSPNDGLLIPDPGAMNMIPNFVAKKPACVEWPVKKVGQVRKHFLITDRNPFLVQTGEEDSEESEAWDLVREDVTERVRSLQLRHHHWGEGGSECHNDTESKIDNPESKSQVQDLT